MIKWIISLKMLHISLYLAFVSKDFSGFLLFYKNHSIQIEVIQCLFLLMNSFDLLIYFQFIFCNEIHVASYVCSKFSVDDHMTVS